MRIGHGYDAHRFAEGRRLILGGVEIPYEKGLEAHSDGDVLCHALIDALLGAAGLGDIGAMFPDSDDSYKDISSLALLRRALELIRGKGFEVTYADCTVIAERPRLAKHITQMRAALAECAGVDCGLINVKATTEEKMGFTGRLEGISAHAVCLLEEKKQQGCP